MTTPEDHLLREAARKIRDGFLRQMASDPDMADARRGFYSLLLVIFKSMREAGWPMIHALVMLATMAWLTMNDTPPPPEPPREE